MISITRHQFLNFIRTKKDTNESLSKTTQHYLAYYDNYIATGKKGNWNFAAYLFPLWSLYRRMYLNGFFGFGFYGIKNLIKDATRYKIYLRNIDIIDGVILLIFIIFCMRYADYLYLVFASKKIAKGINSSGINMKIILFFAALYSCLLLCWIFI